MGCDAGGAIATNPECLDDHEVCSRHKDQTFAEAQCRSAACRAQRERHQIKNHSGQSHGHPHHRRPLGRHDIRTSSAAASGMMPGSKRADSRMAGKDDCNDERQLPKATMLCVGSIHDRGFGERFSGPCGVGRCRRRVNSQGKLTFSLLRHGVRMSGRGKSRRFGKIFPKARLPGLEGADIVRRASPGVTAARQILHFSHERHTFCNRGTHTA